MTPTGWITTYTIDALRDGQDLAPALQEAIRLVMEECGEGFIDSHLVGKAVFGQRLQSTYDDSTERQTLDYVQHLLREAYHVCRYADNHGVYFAHIERECTPKCREHAHRFKEPSRGHCQHCFLELTTTNHCPGGCDDD